jgi:hypothetical protein
MARLQQEKQAAVTTGSAKSSGIPCAMVLTVSFVLSPGDRAFLPPSLTRFIEPSELGASVGAPGPHDFSVRVTLAFVLRNSRVHRIPRSTFVTIAKRPLVSAGRRK